MNSNILEHYCKMDRLCMHLQCKKGQYCCSQCLPILHHDHRENIQQLKDVKNESSVNTNKLKAQQKELNENVDSLMRVIIKGQNNMQKLLQLSYNDNPNSEKLKKLQLNEAIQQVSIDLKFIALHSKMFSEKIEEFQLAFINSMQKQESFQNMETPQEEMNKLTDIQKVIFDNFFDPTLHLIRPKDGERGNESNQEKIKIRAAQDQVERLQDSKEKLVFQGFYLRREQKSVDTPILQEKNIDKIDREFQDKVNIEKETPTDSGSLELQENDCILQGQDVNTLKKDNSSQYVFDNQENNQSSFEKSEQQIKKQLKKRYTTHQKIEIIQELFSKPYYLEKKIIPKEILEKYQICQQTLQNWIKKFKQQ